MHTKFYKHNMSRTLTDINKVMLGSFVNQYRTVQNSTKL